MASKTACILKAPVYRDEYLLLPVNFSGAVDMTAQDTMKWPEFSTRDGDKPAVF